QYTHLIARRVRQLHVYSEVVSPQIQAEELKAYKGIILSGGPNSVYDDGAPVCDQGIFQNHIPVLGLCYGHQLLSRTLGGEVTRGNVHEFGPALLKPDSTHPLFYGVSKETQVWMSHGDEVTRLPNGFRAIGSTPDCRNAAIADDHRKIFGFQFHAEVTHSTEGNAMLRNFLEVCGCSFSWNMDHYVQTLEAQIRKQCEGKKVFLLVSGGVDSTVAFELLNRALGHDRVLGLHIDNGLMRKNESADVLEFMNREGYHNLRVTDASTRFLEKLRGVFAPEEKRKIIGETFLTVKDEALEELHLDPSEWMLAQGTIYPDTIESGGTKHAAVIKTHHNRVQGILDLMAQGKVVEPLAELYKDEVRELGTLLGIPGHLIHRHPFPGPGLGVRLLCSSGKGDEAATSEASTRVEDVLRSKGLSGEILPVKSVGVQGDSRTYAHPCLIRGTRDYAVADAATIDLLNRVRDVNRVVLEIGSLDGSYEPAFAECSRERLDFLREVDDLCTQALRRANLYDAVWQMPVVLLPLNKGGKAVFVLRPVLSSEAMTARFAELPFALLDELWKDLKKIGVGALLYDVTHKPPGTIEWE
ncbi:MAG TPA: glutamine-hydrolyzing GMP synthase, partial [Fibrobacteres bacterium]|nr:glutamine-hydrolyzing GMP synthase [Fibrobacterota bacterium]